MQPHIADDRFGAIALSDLHQRKSEKWTTYPPDVLPAFVAEMDFPLAPSIRRCLTEAVERNDCGYAGLCDLATAFADFARRRFGWGLNPERIIALPDVMAGVSEALRALTPAGSGVAINPPVYPPFFEVVRAAGRTVAEVPLIDDASAGWRLDFEGLERAFAAGARSYLLCSPHNPVGRVWPKSDLRQIAELAQAYNVLVIADEIHAPLTMPGAEFLPFLTVAGEGTECVALHSATKAWNIAGLKCALAVMGSESAFDALDVRLRLSPSDVRWRIGHHGALASAAAFRDESPWLDDLLAYLDGNRRLLADLLRENLPAARYVMPQATYLAWIDCGASALGDSPAKAFLEQGRVALEAGRKFGTGGERHVRLTFGTSSDILREIVARMSRVAAGNRSFYSKPDLGIDP